MATTEYLYIRSQPCGNLLRITFSTVTRQPPKTTSFHFSRNTYNGQENNISIFQNYAPYFSSCFWLIPSDMSKNVVYALRDAPFVPTGNSGDTRPNTPMDIAMSREIKTCLFTALIEPIQNSMSSHPRSLESGLQPLTILQHRCPTSTSSKCSCGVPFIYFKSTASSWLYFRSSGYIHHHSSP